MNLVDILILIVLGFGAYRGFKTGLLLSIIGFFSFFVAIIAAVSFSGSLSAYFIARYPEHETFIPLIVFFCLFVVVILVLTLLGKFLKKIIDMTLLGDLDNIAGLIFGVIKWGFFISTVIWLFAYVGLTFSEDYAEGSTILPILEPIAPIVFEWVSVVIPALKDWLRPFQEMDFKDNKYFTSIL